MNKKIRMLHSEDYPYLEAMDTAIEDDYVGRIFHRLTTGNHRMYGLFLDKQMVSMGGYSIFSGRYAMLGRLRSDRRFRGNEFATELLAYIKNEASQVSGIQWVGANTQEDNIPARRVIEKLELTPYSVLHGAITKDTSALESAAKPWNPIYSIERKKSWLREVYLKSSSVFPYECYYSFPASNALFQEHDLDKWGFYENESETRVLITKYDQKDHHYLHAIYPWSDITAQKGLWETISNDYRKLTKQTEGDTYIWIDLTKEAVQCLPVAHKFELPSPWILYGSQTEAMSLNNTN
ncbi:GNAT family N-acetyltransferase [Bacillaceae bacterium IKA-2]|nr:GNAT family N-acetyltransferase [Bacillaceae bacterium IKA-2]